MKAKKLNKLKKQLKADMVFIDKFHKKFNLKNNSFKLIIKRFFDRDLGRKEVLEDYKLEALKKTFVNYVQRLDEIDFWRSLKKEQSKITKYNKGNLKVISEAKKRIALNDSYSLELIEHSQGKDTIAKTIKELTANQMLHENIAAVKDGEPMPYTKKQFTKAKWLNAEIMRSWNECLPNAKQFTKAEHSNVKGCSSGAMRNWNKDLPKAEQYTKLEYREAEGFNSPQARMWNECLPTAEQFTKAEHTAAEGFNLHESQDWNRELPNAEQYPEIPNWELFLAFAIANIPDVNTEQVIELFNKIDASNWMIEGEIVNDWRGWTYQKIDRLDRVQHTIYNLPLHQTIELPEINKQVTRVAHGLIYESLTDVINIGKTLSNPIYVPIKGECYDTYCNYTEVVKLIESEKQRIRENTIDKKRMENQK